MEKQLTTRWFLGSNSASGFHSLYGGFCAGEDDFLHVIKGGPGTGKSSFMRRIGEAAERRGLDVEYILCSGDPDSLDGVYIPSLHVGYVDGTAPHVLDPAFFGASGDYVNIGRFCAPVSDAGVRREIRSVTERYRSHYERAYSYLSAAYAADPAAYGTLLSDEDAEAARRRARSSAARELPLSPGEGARSERFLSAITCKGELRCEDTLTGLCRRIYALEARLGLADIFLREFADAAAERGHRHIVCRDALSPGHLEAVLLPDRGVAFLAVAPGREPGFKPERTLRLDSIPASGPPRPALRALRKSLSSDRKAAAALRSSAVEALAEAKKLHDELELLYRPYVDFAGLTQAGDEAISSLFD